MSRKVVSAWMMIGFPLTLAAMGWAHAQDSRPVPNYGDYMAACVSAAQPSGGFGSAVEKAVEEATCQCRFERLPKPVMTREQFFNVAKLCQEERGRNPRAFTEQYFVRIGRASQTGSASTTVAAAKTAENAIFRYGAGTEFLGPDCVAVSKQYGKGSWGWANAGIFVDFEKRKGIQFPKAESPYEDLRCAL